MSGMQQPGIFGMVLEKDQSGRVFIVEIIPNSIAQQSESILVGDEVVEIQGLLCRSKQTNEIMRHIQTVRTTQDQGLSIQLNREGHVIDVQLPIQKHYGLQECNSLLDLQDDSLSLDYNSLPKLQDVSIQDTALPPADSPVKPADSPVKHACQEISVQETALPSDASPVQPADSPVKPAEQQQEYAIATIWTIGACFVLKLNGQFVVKCVTPGCSAATSGLQEGLLLEKLNRVKCQGWTQQKLEQTLIGPQGSSVIVRFRDARDQIQRVSVVRDCWLQVLQPMVLPATAASVALTAPTTPASSASVNGTPTAPSLRHLPL